ncbi:uncharacterized protein LOC142635025 [Castanea sativa]|uniref:uncharacterized protein LOC142635025 n=1 Tax=Castanea sativa TaxID=21020 RepID=UPI003F64E1BD
MDHIDKYKLVKEDQQLGKGKAKVVPQNRRDFRSDKYNNNRPQRDFVGQSGTAATQVFSVPPELNFSAEMSDIRRYVRYSPVRTGILSGTNHGCFCTGSPAGTINSGCTVRYGTEFTPLVSISPNGQGGQAGLRSLEDASSRSPLGTINVILTAPGRIGSHPSRVMSIAWPLTEDSSPEPKRSKIKVQPVLSFSNEDKVGTVQSHDDALVVTFRIGGYDVKRVFVDQGFDGINVIPMGQIRLPVQSGSEVVKVDFIVVDACSLYTAIVTRPWLHAKGAVSSTLHLKVKYLSKD